TTSTATSGTSCKSCASRRRSRRATRNSCAAPSSTTSGARRSPAKAPTFLADRSADRRARLVDYLLRQPEYADHWANKWADLLRPNPYRVGIKATRSLDVWIREAFRRNVPYDQFVRDL